MKTTAHTTFTPEIIAAKNASAMALLAASILIGEFEKASAPLVVLPSGDTPLQTYRAMVDHHADRRDIWDRLRYLELDEYIGLGDADHRLFQRWLGRELLDPLNIPSGNRKTFKSTVNDDTAQARAMEDWIAQNGPIDIAVLGLGLNGHVGFNEPGSAFDSATRVVRLTPETIAANARYWPENNKIPETAYTLGLGILSRARRTFLLVSGAHKAGILQDVLNGPVSPERPATYLRTIPNVTIIADHAALGR